MTNAIASKITRLAILGAALLAPAAAEAAITVQASAGTSVLVDKSDDIDSSRGPVTFDIGPGWDVGMLRLEIPLVFGIDEPDVFPRARSTFLGFRPQAKVFPLDWLYAKLSTPILFPGGDGPDVVLAVTVGGGVEISLFEVLLLSAELNLSPHVAPAEALPLEARLGATLRF